MIDLIKKEFFMFNKLTRLQINILVGTLVLFILWILFLWVTDGGKNFSIRSDKDLSTRSVGAVWSKSDNFCAAEPTKQHPLSQRFTCDSERTKKNYKNGEVKIIYAFDSSGTVHSVYTSIKPGIFNSAKDAISVLDSLYGGLGTKFTEFKPQRGLNLSYEFSGYNLVPADATVISYGCNAQFFNHPARHQIASSIKYDDYKSPVDEADLGVFMSAQTVNLMADIYLTKGENTGLGRCVFVTIAEWTKEKVKISDPDQKQVLIDIIQVSKSFPQLAKTFWQ
jgi:hypothetical protein